jgi:hypothetical protein
MFGGFTTEELGRLAIQHIISRPRSSVDLFRVEGYSESSIVAVGPPLLIIIEDREIAPEWIESIKPRSFEGNFSDCAYFQALALLNSIENLKKVGFSVLWAVAFSSPQVHMVKAPPNGMRDTIEGNLFSINKASRSLIQKW